jgi:hypothetical protein
VTEPIGTVLAMEWHVGQVFLSLLWLTLFAIWVWLIIGVGIDIFASPELSGPAKAAWILFLVVAPYLGVFVYLIVRGNRMTPLTVRFGMPRAAPAPLPVLTRAQVEALDRLNAERDAKAISAAEYRTRREAILA